MRILSEYKPIPEANQTACGKEGVFSQAGTHKTIPQLVVNYGVSIRYSIKQELEKQTNVRFFVTKRFKFFNDMRDLARTSRNAPGSLTGAQYFLTQAKALRCGFEQFVVLKKIQALLQTQNCWRSKIDAVIRPGGPNVR